MACNQYKCIVQRCPHVGLILYFCCGNFSKIVYRLVTMFYKFLYKILYIFLVSYS